MTIVVAVLLAVAAGALAVRLGRAGDADRPAPSPSPLPASAPPAHAACEARPVREACAAVEVEGRAVRYALLRAATPTTDTVLVDLGGPGITVLSGQFTLSALPSALGERGAAVNLLVVEEPWVQRDVPLACRTALTAFYRAVRADADAPALARALTTACEVGAQPRRWGWTPEGYVASVAAILRAEQLALRGVVASSFGSVRWQWLASAPAARDVAWAVLLRPYPLGATGREVVQERAAAATRLLDRPMQPLRGSQTVPARTTPVTRFDQLSAAVELGYVADPAAHAAVLGGNDLPRLARLSDSLWLRYGNDDVSAGYLAYLDEVCPVGGTWPGAEPLDTVRGILVASHLPCQQRAVVGPHAPTTPTVATAPRQPTCVVTAARDAVTPTALVRRAYGRFRQVRLVTVADAAHGSFDGVAGCFAALAAT